MKSSFSVCHSQRESAYALFELNQSVILSEVKHGSIVRNEVEGPRDRLHHHYG